MRKKKHKTKPTSLLAYAEILEDLGSKQAKVYHAIRELRSCSNTMISKYLRLPINCIVGRVFELRSYGIVMEDKKDICQVTGKLVIWWRCRRRL